MLYKSIMKPNITKMNIKKNIFLVELFQNCTYDGTTVVSNGIKMFGEPMILGNRGNNRDEIHVLMYWSGYNVRPIGKVVGLYKE